jgi:hypothetical protein
MNRSVLAVAASILMVAVPAIADDTASPVFPNGWFSLNAEEAGIVFMMRAYGADVSFDIIDETGRIIDHVALPNGRTVIAQYRVPPGTYRARFFDEDMEAKAAAGLFAALGVAVTHVPASAGKPEGVWPSYAPFANYTPAAMVQRVTPLAALGTTDFLPPEQFGSTTIEFRVKDEDAP